MNKRGEMVLRDIVFMIIIFSGIIALSSIFVSEMGTKYNNANMTASYNQNSIGIDNLTESGNKWASIAEGLNGNFLEMIGATLRGAVAILGEVIKAPITFGSMVSSVLADLGVSSSRVPGEMGVTEIIGFMIAAALYILIAFVIVSAFLKGGKL